MKTSYDMCFAERTKKIRTEKNISQDKLAVAIEYSQSAIALWEAGNREPSVDAVVNFANYFNLSVDYLLGLSNDKQPFDKAIVSSFADRLKELRLESELTQDELAEKTGISQSSIAAWEVGKTLPKLTLL